jgi:hypothetical protein
MRKVSSDLIFKFSRRIARSLSYSFKINDQQSSFVSQLLSIALPGFYALTVPKLVASWLGREYIRLILLIVAFTAKSIFKPLSPPRAFNNLSVSRYPNTLGKSLILLIPSSYIIESISVQLTELINSFTIVHNFDSLVFLSEDMNSLNLILEKFIINHQQFNIKLITLFPSQEISTPFLVRFIAIKNLLPNWRTNYSYSQFLKQRLHPCEKLLSFFLLLYLRRITLYIQLFSEYIRRNNDIPISPNSLVLNFDCASPSMLSFKVILSRLFPIPSVSIPWAVYGLEALEWCSTSTTYLIARSPHFANLFRQLIPLGSNKPSIVISNISDKYINKAEPNELSSSLRQSSILVIGPMDPWPDSNNLSLRNVYLASIRQFTNALINMPVSLNVIIRPHPLNPNHDVRYIIESIKGSRHNLLPSYSSFDDDMQRCSTILSFFPSTIYLKALINAKKVILINPSYLPKWSLSWLPRELILVDSPTPKSLHNAIYQSRDSISCPSPLFMRRSYLVDLFYSSNNSLYHTLSDFSLIA